MGVSSLIGRFKDAEKTPQYIVCLLGSRPARSWHDENINTTSEIVLQSILDPSFVLIDNSDINSVHSLARKLCFKLHCTRMYHISCNSGEESVKKTALSQVKKMRNILTYWEPTVVQPSAVPGASNLEGMVSQD